jgi:hydrogenase-4 component B
MMILNGAGGCEEGVVLATCGLMLHMVNHSLIKLVLFTAAGVVVMDAHSLDLNRIRGFGRRKTFLKIAFALGALGISGVPLFNGYISKTLLHEGIVEGIHTFGAYAGLLRTAEWIFLISGGLTFAYMLKLFIALFIEKNEDPARQTLYDKEGQGMGIAGIISVFGSSLILPVLGQPYVMTRLAMRMSGYEEILHFKAFSLENLKGGGISLIIGAAVYLLIVRRVLMENGTYADRWPSGLDLENRVYRPLLLKILPAIGGFIASLFAENVVLKPLAKLSVILGAFCGRVLETSTDAVIMFFRKTILREKPVVGGKKMHPGLLRTVAEETAEAVQPLVQNFTFAMLMTCVGIVLILAIIMLYSF